MKKLLFSLPFCLFVFISSAQTQRLVLVEEFTNASCGPCALSNPAFNALMTANATKVVAIRNHTSFPGYDPFYSHNMVQNQARTIYYQITGTPTGRMEGGGVFLGDINQTSINAAYAIAPFFDIKLTYYLSADNDSIYAKASVKALSTISGALKAHIVVVEKMVTFTTAPGSNGETSFPMVMKKMLPSETGTLLPATMNAGDSVVINVGWLLANVYNINQLAMVGFVQDNNTKNIKQAAYAPTPQTNNPPVPPVISLNNISNALCTNNGAININVSGGTLPYTYLWSNGATTQDISGLNIGSYTVTVTGGNASAATTYTVQQQTLSKPVITSFNNKTGCQLVMNWALVNGADNYKIRYKPVDSANWSLAVTTGNVSAYLIENLIPGAKYQFAIASFCDNGATSGYIAKTDSTNKCEMITNGSVAINSSASATLSWTESCISIGYKVIYRPQGTTTWTVKSTAIPNQALVNLLPNTIYEYRIRNRCAAAPNVSAWSPVASFMTPAQRIENDAVKPTATDLFVYPNPNAADFNIAGSFNEHANSALLEIYNGIGQVIYSQRVLLDNGTYDFQVSLPAAVSDGLYFATIFSGTEKQQSPLFIQR